MSNLLALQFSGFELVAAILAVITAIAVVYACVARIVLWFRYHNLNNVETEGNQTAYEATRALLDANDMQDVQVKKCGFWRAWLWGNSYSVRKKTIFLRKGIINQKSITAVGVGLQKVGLAIMDKRGDKKIKTRSILLPLTYLAPTLFIPIVIIGLVFDFVIGFTGVPTIIAGIVGIVLYFLAFVYMIINIPVEKQANRLAMGIMEKSNFLTAEEREQVNKLFKSYITMYVVDFIIALLRIIQAILKIIISTKGN